MTIFLSFWREIAIGLLLLAAISVWELYQRERDDRISVETEYRTKAKEAEDQRKMVVARSDEAIKKLSEEHKTNLEKVEANAYKNFIARYGDPYALRVSNLPRPAGASASDRPRQTDGESEKPVLTGFVQDCAADVVTIQEWQRWARLNKLPVEGE